MPIADFIESQSKERQGLLHSIHEIILREDKNVKADVGSMMGKEMIMYKAFGVFKYGLSSVKNYLSLHIMPIYGSPKLHAKYKALLPGANFQKGCINFKNAEEMPLKIIEQLIVDCSGVNLLSIKENYLKTKPARSR